MELTDGCCPLRETRPHDVSRPHSQRAATKTTDEELDAQSMHWESSMASSAAIVLRNVVYPKGPRKGEKTSAYKVRAAFAFVLSVAQLVLRCMSPGFDFATLTR